MMSVHLVFVYVVYDHKQYKVKERGNYGFATLRNKKLFEVVVRKIRILHVNFADYSDLYLLFARPLYLRKYLYYIPADFFVLRITAFFEFCEYVIEYFVARRIRRTFFSLVRFCLVITPHHSIAVNYSERKF